MTLFIHCQSDEWKSFHPACNLGPCLPELQLLLCDKVALLDKSLLLRMLRQPVDDLRPLLMKQFLQNTLELTSVVDLNNFRDPKVPHPVCKVLSYDCCCYTQLADGRRS